MLASGLQALSDDVALLFGFVAMLALAVLVLRSPPRQSLVLSVLVLLVGSALLAVAVHGASQPQPPFNPDLAPTVFALASAPCVIGGLGLLLWLRRRKN